MDREACRAAIHGVAKSRTRLSDWTELSWLHAAATSLSSHQREEWILVRSPTFDCKNIHSYFTFLSVCWRRFTMEIHNYCFTLKAQHMTLKIRRDLHIQWYRTIENIQIIFRGSLQNVFWCPDVSFRTVQWRLSWTSWKKVYCYIVGGLWGRIQYIALCREGWDLVGREEGHRDSKTTKTLISN